MFSTHKNKRVYSCSLTTLALILSFPTVGYSVELEEVIVTAQKREQSLQDVGITITAFGEAMIKNRGLTSVDQLAAAIPNLQALDDAAGQTHFRMRGIGLNEFQSSFEAPVGVNVDEYFLSKPFMASMGFFDVQRIEALKGPQGTVFGRNTTGGAVNYYTNKPTEEFEAGVRATYANYKRFEVDGFISGSITEQLTGRLSFRIVDQNDGPYLNLFNNEKIGGKESTQQVKGQLQWTNEKTTILASAHYGSQEGELTPYDNLFQDIPGGAHAGGVTDIEAVIRNPIGRFTVNQDYFPTRDNISSGFNLRVDHDLGWATISSLSSYEYFERDQREDSDNTPVASVNIDWYSKINQYTQELRLSGERDSWNYLFGAYYEKDDLIGVDTIDVGAVRLGDEYTQVTNSYALFTNHEYAVTDQFSLILGARYTEEKTDFDGASYLALGVGEGIEDRIDPATYLTAVLSDTSRKDTSFNFKVGANYKPSEDITLYASYSTGFRSGGFDIGFNTDLIIFEPEDVSAFEAGVKSVLLDGSMTLNAAFFYTTVDNYQENANLPGELTPRRRNVGKLETKGVEIDMNWHPTERLTITASGGYTDAKISESDFLFGTIPIVGNVPANTPEFSTNIFVSYAQPVNDDYELEFMASWTWVDKRYLEIENEADHLVSSYNTLDGRIILNSLNADWQVSLWAKNLTNERYLRYINDVPGFGLFLPVNNAPRSYGVTVEYNF
ncbi:MAG: hypothetical protein COB54_00130 [Alphaproteobacteria bacterium]|nr:MAG: hypothetical protein COB54_00130 [Alphaproteobacteria bacterium]